VTAIAVFAVPEYWRNALRFFAARALIGRGCGSTASEPWRALARVVEMGYQQAKQGDCRKISRQLVFE
jgi:hypothetical protein